MYLVLVTPVESLPDGVTNFVNYQTDRTVNVKSTFLCLNC